MNKKMLVCSVAALAILLAGCTGGQADRTAIRLEADDNPNYTIPESALGVTEPQENKEEITLQVDDAPISAVRETAVVSTEPQEDKEEPVKEQVPDVIYVPTPQDVVDKMLEMAQVTKDNLVYDLGCGDGRIVVTAAMKHGCKAIGYDIDPQRVKESLENVEKSKVGNLVTIEQKDIFTLDLSEADVVTLYLLPSLNERLIPQLEKLRPGSRIVSHDFRMKGVKPDKVVRLTSTEDNSKHKIYLWTTPLKKAIKKNKTPAEKVD